MARKKRPGYIDINALHDRKSSFNERLPGTFQRRLGLLARRVDEQSSNGAMDKTGRAVIPGSRLFKIVFGFPRNGENISRSFGTFQSGSPPGQDFGELSRVVLSPISVSPGLVPITLAVQPDDTRLYVGNAGNGVVTQIDITH